MKTFSNLFLFTILLTSLSLKAQTIDEKSKPVNELSPVKPDDVKANFIKDQNYLYPASELKDYKSYYGDSLNGFDEVNIKVGLLNHGVYGQEYIGYISILKRNYINKKYGIGQLIAKPAPQLSRPLQPSQTANRPGGGGNTINLFPCVNEDFELSTPGAYTSGNAVAGWIISSRSRTVCGFTGPFSAGSPEFSVIATPVPNVLPSGNVLNVTAVGNSPLGGSNVVLLNNQVANNNELETKISQTFPVTSANALFQFAFAGLWQDGGHLCCEQPALAITMYNCNGVPLTCSSVSLNAYGTSCLTGATGYSTTTTGWSWTNWQSRFIDLTPYIGSCVTIEISNSDCIFGGHAGSVYIDCRCGGNVISPPIPGPGGITGGVISFCAGSNAASVMAPLGYSTYQWYGPGNPPVVMSPTLGGNTYSLNIPNPIVGSVYTVGLVTASGCSYTAIDTLQFTLVSILGTTVNPSCPGGASGSAIVQGNGSGTGYNYNWYAFGSNISIGTTQAISGLAPGIYSVNISGLGAAGCGSAAATVTVSTSPPNVYTVIKPFCGNIAYLSSSGSNFQWYGGIPLAAIPGVAGGTAPNYNVISPPPFNGEIFWLTYFSPQGCRDSVEFLLNQTPAGAMYVQNVSYACPNVGNASAEVVLIPASGSPGGINSFSVWSNAPTPTYTSSIFPTAINGYTPTGMAAGSYDVTAFDGSCYYNTTFIVNAYNYNYAVTPVTSTLCPGNTIIAGVSFTNAIVPGQFDFNWSPSTWINGGVVNTSNISVQIAPSIPVNSVITTVYTITVRPAIVNCPITKTISVTAVNLQVPSITTPTPFCTNVVTPKSITVSPAGNYTFSTASGSWLNANTGVINPVLTSAGSNTFMVTAAVSTCIISNTGNFDVSKFNSAALTASISNLCVTNPCVNLMSIVASQVNGVWTPTAGVSNNIFCPANLTTGLYVLNYNTTSNPDPQLCPDSRTLAVSVSQTVNPFITPHVPFCTNAPSFNMLVSPTGGSWSGGPPLMITPGGVVNPVFATLGNNSITYVVNTGPCVNVATTILNATQFRSAALTGSISNLCVNSTPVNLMNIVQQPSGNWSGPNVSGNVFTPNLATGNYTLYYNTTSSPNPVVCPDSRSIVVYVLNPSTPVIAQPSPHCNVDAPFQIMVTPNTGSFTPTSFLTAEGLFTPSLCPVGNNMLQYTIGTSTCNVQDAKQISIEAYIPPTITGSIPDQCNTNAAINLSSLTINNTGNWVGPGMIGSSFNPNLSGAGKIIVSYNTSSFPSGLCPAQATLAVNVYSLATPTINDEGPFCNSFKSIQLRVSPVGGLFSGQNNDAVDVLGRFSPVIGVIGDNIVNYSITAGPCVAYAQAVIKVEKFISADFSKYAGPFCKDATPFDLNSITQNPGGNFSNLVGSGVDPNSGMFNPANANIGNGNVIYYQTHSMPTASLCPDTSYMRIQVNDLPNVSITSNTIKGCSPVEVVFDAPHTSGGKGEWILGDGTDPIDGLTINHTYTSPGTYSVVFNYWDELGCTSQAILGTPVTVYGNPTAAFSYGPYGEDLTISNPVVQFTNLSTVLGGNTYQWQIDTLYLSTDVNPTVTFPKIGKYQITLLATSVYGCKDKTSQELEVRNDFGIYIPNTFTPNDDGLNDIFIPVFTPYGLDAKTFDMEIFDRWGTSLYHTKDVTKGWNGSIQNKGPDPLKDDGYVYKIKYKDMNGNVYNKLGKVILLR